MRIDAKCYIMRIKVSMLCLSLFLVCGCSLDNSDCASMCTTDFRYVTVKFSNSSGQPVVVDGYKAVNLRTGLTIQTPQPDTTHFKGTYIVASDANIVHLSASGDTIEVTAVNPKTAEEKSARFVVSGGECNCHITKLAGPSQIVFN